MTSSSNSMIISAEDIYLAIKNQSIQRIDANATILAPTNLNATDSDSFVTAIEQLRAQDFDGYLLKAGNEKILIKHHASDVSEKLLNPLHKHEAEIQALRYMHGVLLIANNLPSADKDKFINVMQDTYRKYLEQKSVQGASSPLTLQLAETLAQDLSQLCAVDMEDAKQQLLMARDLGSLLERHPTVCTVTAADDHTSVEISTPNRVSKEYYDDPTDGMFTNLATQDWLSSAKKLAGYHKKETNTWLDHFFSDKNNQQAISASGASAPPSARWLPIPANTQLVEIVTFTEQEPPSHQRVLRSGVIVPYDLRRVSDKSKQEKYQLLLAKNTLMEIIHSQLATQINQFKTLYGELIDGAQLEFDITYQTLLAPLFGERHLGHIDNNAKFVDQIKVVVADIVKSGELQREISREHGIKVRIHHTNAALNTRADFVNEFKDDRDARDNKINEFHKIRERIWNTLLSQKIITHPPLRDLKTHMLQAGWSADLVHELIQRERACECLQAVLEKKPPYDKLKTYQQNVMLAALETLSMGSQSLNIVGCTTGRDKTGIYFAAVKAMQENGNAMSDWNVLEAMMVKSLNRGHHFRSMSHHVAVINLANTLPHYMRKVSSIVQEKMRELSAFMKKTPSTNLQTTAGQHNQEAGLHDTIDQKSTVAIDKDTAKKLIREIEDAQHNKVASANRSRWEHEFTNFSEQINLELYQHSLDHLDQYLNNKRVAQMDAKSFVVYLPKEGAPGETINIRVFPKKEVNIEASADDFFASGIDSARGLITILKFSVADVKSQQHGITLITHALKQFHENISKIKANGDDEMTKLKLAQAEYRKFTGSLIDIALTMNCYDDEKLAAAGILEARNFCWIQARKDEAVCTIRDEQEGTPTALSFAKRMTFPTEGANSGEYEQDAWFRDFEHKHPWVNAFYKANPTIFTLSPTPMQRRVPTPANAWEEASISYSPASQRININSGISLAITSPYSVKNKDERLRLTVRNHLLMASDSRLASYTRKHLVTWKDLTAQNTIIIPILHQTLLDPGAIRYIANRTGGNPKNMVKLKHLANQELRKYLEKQALYYDKDSDEVVINPSVPPKNFLRVQFQVLDTNNGINIHEKMTHVRDHDITDAAQLIDMVKDKLVLLANKRPKTLSAINTIIRYLNESTLKHPRPLTASEEETMLRLCKELYSGEFAPTIHPDTQRNLALVILAGTNLASFLSNQSGNNITGYARDILGAVHSKYAPSDLNDSTYKACYERILAESLGVCMGGCKSSADRAKEVLELTHAMYRQFDREGKISNYHDSNLMKQHFRATYLNTQHKHNMLQMITTNAGSTDRETLGQAYQKETKAEKTISKLLESTCRHNLSEPVKLRSYLQHGFGIASERGLFHHQVVKGAAKPKVVPQHDQKR